MFNFLNRKSKNDDLRQSKKFLTDHLNQLLGAKEKIPSDVFDVTKFFIEENLDLYESMDILMKKNHFRGCLPMARSLFENSINLQYIYKADTESRAKNFKQAAANAFLKRLNSLEKITPELVEMKKVFENELKGYVPDKKTLKEKAAEVNSESLYKDAYKRLSEYVHGGYKANRDLNEERPYNMYLRRVVFSDTLLITLEALKYVCERFDLDGGAMMIDDPGYKATIFFSTNPKKQEEYDRKVSQKK